MAMVGWDRCGQRAVRVWTKIGLHGWMDGWMVGWMDGWMDYQSSSFTEGSVVNVISQV
jgi:hypothetical protein